MQLRNEAWPLILTSDVTEDTTHTLQGQAQAKATVYMPYMHSESSNESALYKTFSTDVNTNMIRLVLGWGRGGWCVTTADYSRKKENKTPETIPCNFFLKNNRVLFLCFTYFSLQVLSFKDLILITECRVINKMQENK